MTRVRKGGVRDDITICHCEEDASPTRQSTRSPSGNSTPIELPFLSPPSLLLLETDTEADKAEAVAGVEVEAAGRTQARAAIDPGAAPIDTEGARSADIERISLGTRFVISPSIRRPLPHISIHIEKAPWVGGKLSDIHRLVRVRTMIPVRIRTGNCVSP